MNISTLTKLASIFCITISVVTLGLVVLMNRSIDEERRYIERQLEFRELGYTLGQASDFLTREARRYTIFGDKRHFDAYWKEVKETKSRDKVVERLNQMDAEPIELALIETAKANSDALIATEDEAMNAVKAGDLKRAQTLMFDERYDRNKEIIMMPIREFQKIMNTRAEKEARTAREKASILLVLTQVTIVVYVLLVLLGLYFIFIRKLTHPLVKMTQAIDQVAKGDMDVEIPYADSSGEIGRLGQVMTLFKESLAENQDMADDLIHSKDRLETENTRTKLLFKIATEAAMAETPEEVLEICMEQICFYTKWSIGHVYKYDCGQDLLVPTKIWHLENTRKVSGFKDVTESSFFKSGEGLPGRVMQAKDYAIIPDIALDDNFTRKDALVPLNIKSGIAFPIIINNEVAYVIEFFTVEDDIELNDEIEKTIQFAINQICQSIERTTFTLDLAAAKEKAEAANFSKSRFLATMSHEIRTPLNGVVGMSELLMNTELTTKQQKYAETINSSSDVLLSIIGDILDFSKIEAGEMDLSPVPMNLYRHIKDLMSVMNTAAEESNVEFIFKYDPDIPDAMLLDPVRIKQMILNLVGNAVKFTGDGYVIISMTKIDGDDSGNLRIRFEIEDNGIGIAPEKQEEIFENFTQADVSTTREYGGTGLGLAICKKLIELMNGRIGVESEAGKGSLFWFEIPAVEVEATKNSKRPALGYSEVVDSIQKQNVLIVDDFAPNREVLEGYLQSWNVKCQSVSSAKTALEELARAEKDGQPYTLALVDYMMPEMNGEALAREIHARAETKDLPLIMVTAAYKIKDVNRAKEKGFKQCVLKPIYASELMDAMLEALGEGRKDVFIEEQDVSEDEDVSEQNGASGIIMLPNGEKPKILVVEDSRVNQMFAEEILEELGCKVEIAANGVLAFKQYQKKSYDLVLMDCMMPEMDGYEATQMIREYDNDNNREHMPIVAMTANAMEGDKEKCLEAGMDDYIAKPARREDIKLILEKYLSGGV